MTLANLEKTLLFLVILLLPTQLGRHFWPEFSFVYSLPIDYLSPTIYFWDILMLGLWAVFLFSGKHINSIALNLYYFFILTQSLSLLPHFGNQFYTGPGLVRLEQYTIVGLLGVYLASIKPNINFFLPLSLSLVAESILSIAQFLKSSSTGFWILGERTFSISTPAIAKFDFYSDQFLRPYATFPHPNVLAAFLVIALILLFGLTSPKSNRRIPFGHWLNLTSLFLGMMTLLLTVSRTAILAAVVAGFVLLKKKGKFFLIIALMILLPVLFTRYSSLISYDSLTFSRREQLSEIAGNLWAKFPLLGVGINNFIPSGADLLLVGPSRFLQPVHNILLLELSETGLVGLIGFLILIGYPLIKLYQNLPSQKVMLLIWGVVLFLGMFDHFFLTLPQGYRLLFLVWGLSFSVLE